MSDIVAKRDKAAGKADCVLIEDKGSGTSLIQDLKADHVYCIAIKPEGDKVVRMSACSARIESGSVLLPRCPPSALVRQVGLLRNGGFLVHRSHQERR